MYRRMEHCVGIQVALAKPLVRDWSETFDDLNIFLQGS